MEDVLRLRTNGVSIETFADRSARSSAMLEIVPADRTHAVNCADHVGQQHAGTADQQHDACPRGRRQRRSDRRNCDEAENCKRE